MFVVSVSQSMDFYHLLMHMVLGKYNLDLAEVIGWPMVDVHGLFVGYRSND